MNNIETIIKYLIIALSSIVGILSVILVILYIKSKINKDSTSSKGSVSKIDNTSKNNLANDKKSVFDFLEFDDISDNMIVQDKGAKYLMIIECQGINYDLMSEVEKTAVEDGFVQFLNTLRYKIQIYIQTRKVDLEKSINSYQKSVNSIESELRKDEIRYKEMIEAGTYKQSELDAQLYELTKKRNLYEYGEDIIKNTEAMSLNKGILTKKYYIVVPYYTAEIEKNDFDKREIQNMAFSELYTRCQSVIRTLYSCEVKGHILNSKEIIDLLYVAYNRDEAEVYGIDRYIDAGYESIYSTAPDVLDRRIKALDEEIRNKAMQKVNEKISEVELKKRRRIKQKEENKEESIDELALIILQENQNALGEEVVEEAKKKIKKESKKREKGGNKNVGVE